VNDLDQLVIGVAVFQLFVDVSQVVEVQLSLALHVQKSEVGLASLLREGVALNNNKKYDAGGEFFEESFKVEGVSTGGVIDFLEESEDKLVFGLKAEGAGSEEEFSDISPSLSGIGVEGEEGVQLTDVFCCKDWIFGSNVLGKDVLQLLLLDLSL